MLIHHYVVNEITAKEDALNISIGKKLTDSKYRPMRHYFLQGQDDFIYRILFNYFRAVSSVFIKEWNTPDRYILTKTTGFGALISVLRKIIAIGIDEKDLSYEFFLKLFQDVKKDFDNRKIELTSHCYGSGKLAQKQLRDEFLRPLESVLKRVII